LRPSWADRAKAEGGVSTLTPKPPRIGLWVVGAVLGSVLLGGIHSARAQGGGPPAAHPAGTAVDVGDSWQINLGAVTLHPGTSDAGPTAYPALLSTSLTVHNRAPEARYFLTYRLRLLSVSGAAFQATWCRGVDQSLEMAPPIPHQGTATGAAC
jgi:hypothetical protein